MGIEAAMIEIALSADPKMTSCVVESDRLVLAMFHICVVLMQDVTPALRAEKLAGGWMRSRGGGKATHNIPMLMAIKTPIGR